MLNIKSQIDGNWKFEKKKKNLKKNLKKVEMVIEKP